MSSNFIPPFKFDDVSKVQEQTDLHLFFRRLMMPEVIRMPIGNIAGIGANLAPYLQNVVRAGVLKSVRAYASAPGSGNMTIDVKFGDRSGAYNSVFAVAGDRLTKSGTHLMTETPCTATNNILDPAGFNIGYINCDVTAFTGTGWTAVVVELILDPYLY